MPVEPPSGGSGWPDGQTRRGSAQRGETVWLDELIEGFRAPVLRLAGHWLGSAEEAEEVAENQPNDAPTPEQAGLTKELRQQARATVDRLPDHDRTPLLRHCFQGLFSRAESL